MLLWRHANATGVRMSRKAASVIYSRTQRVGSLRRSLSVSKDVSENPRSPNLGGTDHLLSTIPRLDRRGASHSFQPRKFKCYGTERNSFANARLTASHDAPSSSFLSGCSYHIELLCTNVCDERRRQSTQILGRWRQFSSNRGLLGNVNDQRRRWGSILYESPIPLSAPVRHMSGSSHKNDSSNLQPNKSEDKKQVESVLEDGSTLESKGPNGAVSSRPRAPDDSKGDNQTRDDHVRSILSQLRSVPNIITVSRIVSAPVLSYFIATDRFDLAISGCIIFGFSDWLDGYIARNYAGQATVLGTYLDPFADKFIINVLSASLWYVSLLPGPIVALWLVRDVGLLSTAYMFVANRTEPGKPVMDPSRTPLKVTPTFVSKVNTVLQFATISAGMAQPLFGLPEEAVLGLCWVTAGTTVASGLSYLGGGSMVSNKNKSRRDSSR